MASPTKTNAHLSLSAGIAPHCDIPPCLIQNTCPTVPTSTSTGGAERRYPRRHNPSPGAQMEGAPRKGTHSLPGILTPPGGRRGCAVAKGRERQRPVWMPRSPPTPPRLGRGRERDIALRCKSKPQQARQVERMPPYGAVAAPLGEVRETRGGPLVCHVRDELPPRVSSAGWETLERVRRHNGRTRCQIGRASAGAAEPAHARGVPPTHRRNELETAPTKRAATDPVANASPQLQQPHKQRRPQRQQPPVKAPSYRPASPSCTRCLRTRAKTKA